MLYICKLHNHSQLQPISQVRLNKSVCFIAVQGPSGMDSDQDKDSSSHVLLCPAPTHTSYLLPYKDLTTRDDAFQRQQPPSRGVHAVAATCSAFQINGLTFRILRGCRSPHFFSLLDSQVTFQYVTDHIFTKFKKVDSHINQCFFTKIHHFCQKCVIFQNFKKSIHTSTSAC